MKYIEVIADSGSFDTVAAIAEQFEAADLRTGPIDEAGMQWGRMLVSDSRVQATLDALNSLLGMQTAARITVLPVEIALPKPSDAEQDEEGKAVAAREALRAAVEKGSRLDLNYVVLVLLSTVVAAIGLIEDNVAVVIGAMVIAPLLGPNLAFALGTALGDIRLMRESIATLLFGALVAIGASMVIGYGWPIERLSYELLTRTDVGMDSAALALASGAAAALSLTSGLPAVLVGVMVAVALLPPAATVGIMIGQGQMELALGAALLLALNVVCVNLACKIVFLIKRIAPRGEGEKARARRAMTTYIMVWVVMLALLAAFVYLRQRMVTG